jgi:hypothetical protein
MGGDVLVVLYAVVGLIMLATNMVFGGGEPTPRVPEPQALVVASEVARADTLDADACYTARPGPVGPVCSVDEMAAILRP